MLSAGRVNYMRILFTVFVAVLAGCASQRTSMLPSASDAASGVTTQAKIVSRTIHVDGQTYVVDEMYTPTTASL
jgi:biopolymer transport protein ExbD